MARSRRAGGRKRRNRQPEQSQAHGQASDVISLRRMLMCLRFTRAPLVLMVMVFWLFQISKLDMGNAVYLSEDFAGKHAVTSAIWESGEFAINYDINNAAITQDIMTDIGFANALAITVKTQIAKMTAPVCSTWVWLSRGETCRSGCNPLGNQSRPCVKNANAMVVRTVLLCMICVSLGVFVILEQPINSLMEMHPFFQRMLGLIKFYRKSVT